MTKKQRLFDSIVNLLITIVNLTFIYFIQANNVKPNILWFFIVCYVLISLVFIICELAIIFNLETLNKLCIIMNIILLVLVVALFIIQKFDLFEKFNSIDEIKAFINHYGNASAIIFMLIQFLQVTILPLPSALTIIAGVALFGTVKASILSCIGIITGSMFAFWLGKVFGTKLVVWICGESAFKKYQEFTSGKDKLLLFLMFLLPFFPDDLLCMVAGLSTMRYSGFFLMMLIVRPIGIVFTAGVFDSIIKIPFAGWGILFWISAAILFIALIIVLWKYGAKIQTWLGNFSRKIETKIKSVFRKAVKKDNNEIIEPEIEAGNIEVNKDEKATLTEKDKSKIKNLGKNTEDLDYKN